MHKAYTLSDDVEELLISKEPGVAVLCALRELLAQDAFLLEYDVNERSLTHRFAIYLQSVLAEWHVDCEYNRDGHDPKRVNVREVFPGDDDTDAKTVFPDVIAHRRGTGENYLVVEFKKSSSRLDRNWDIQKLTAYVSELNYAFALFVELGVGDQCGDVHVEWIGQM